MARTAAPPSSGVDPDDPDASVEAGADAAGAADAVLRPAAVGDQPSSSLATGAPARRRPPRAVWAATALFGLVMVLWTVAVPVFRAPDEAAHLDLVLYLADGNGYPSYDGRFFGEEANLDSDRHLVSLRLPWPRFDADDAVPRSERPDAYDLGLEPDAGARRNDEARAGYPYVYNQMPQHPPVPYLMQSEVLQAERWLLPGHGVPSMDKELGLLRLFDVLLVLPMPLLAWAVVARMGGSDRAGTVAALLPLGVPQLLHIGSALTNDALLILEGGLLALLLTGVGRGVRTRRTDVAVGLVLGLALLTKAFAVMYIPWVAAAYLLGAWTLRRWRVVLDGLLAGALAVAIGAWWWVANWMREGEPAPTTETLTRTEAQQPPGFEPEPLRFLLQFPGRLLSRTWAWVGHGSPKFELPVAVTVVLTLVVAAAGGIAWWTARRGRATGEPALPNGDGGGDADEVPGEVVVEVADEAGRAPRRVDVVMAWLPAVLITLFVARRALGLYETTGKVAFIQGRYLYSALVPPLAVVGLGVARALGRWAVLATLAAVAVLQAWVLGEVVDGAWTGPGTFGSVRGALAWAPWPPAVVGLVAAGVVALTAWLAVDGVRALRRRPS